MLAEGDYARIATYDERFLSTQSLRELEDALPPALFFRIHRSSIVNLQKVTTLEQSLARSLGRAALGRRGHATRGRAAPDARAQAAPGAARVRRRAGARRGRRCRRPALGAVRRRRRHRDRARSDRARLAGAPRDGDLARGHRRDGGVRHASATRSTTSSCGSDAALIGLPAVVGVVLGTTLAKRVRGPHLQLAFAFVMVVVAGRLAW